MKIKMLYRICCKVVKPMHLPKKFGPRVEAPPPVRRTWCGLGHTQLAPHLGRSAANGELGKWGRDVVFTRWEMVLLGTQGL